MGLFLLLREVKHLMGCNGSLSAGESNPTAVCKGLDVFALITTVFGAIGWGFRFYILGFFLLCSLWALLAVMVVRVLRK
jgi:hypothetical protein